MIAHLYAYLVLQYIVHDDPDLVSLAQTFASYSALSVWPNALYVSLRSYLRSQQIMAPIAVVDFATVGLYIVSNYVFIYGCLGWNGLGFVGSPLASFFCATMQPLALFVYAFVVQRHHEKTWTGWSWQCLDQVRLKQFVTLTSSLFVYLAMDEWIYNVVTVVAVTVVGFALGSIATVVVVVVLLVGRRPLVGVFTQDPALHDILDTVLPVFCIAASISGLHVMLSSVLEAMSLALTLVVMSGVGSWGILLPVSYYLGISEALGLAGLWWGSVVGEAAKFMFTGIALFGLYDWAAIAHRIARDTEAIAVAEEVEALTSADTVKSPVAAATNSSSPPIKSAEGCEMTATIERTPLLATTRSLYSTKAVVDEMTAIFAICWKISLATFCQLSVLTISTVFLGHLGTHELAACAMVMSVIGGFRIIAWAFSISISTVRHAYGAKNFELVGVWLQIGLIVLTPVSVLLMIVCWNIRPCLEWMTDDLELLAMGETYAWYVSWSVWPTAVYEALRGYYKAQEIMIPTTVVDVTTLFISIGMKYCLNAARLRQYLELTGTFLVYLALDEWVYNVLAVMAARLGSLNVAAYNILFTIWTLAYGLYIGFSTPIQVRVSHALGANDPDKAKQTAAIGCGMGSFAAVVLSAAMYVGRYELLALYTPDEDLQNVVLPVLGLFCVAASLSGVHITLSAMLEAMSLARTLVIASCVGSWLVLLPVAYEVAFETSFGFGGLYIGSVIGESVKLIIMAVALVWVYDWRVVAERVSKQVGSDHEGFDV
ncbi:hypothetical protein DYB32_001024 [Aphanomyces invadans]|uniref:Multidrug/Oligosaccharidyl-lipid/Polysaccharide (MOP) Flippase Superfamily n=1 Tax=Aphanomyces invadans TaxID=157072 RepID=A0A3R6Z504_9STRA|nr:hypothetical protein DYB32_001024 [Aphanomyces invadans]